MLGWAGGLVLAALGGGCSCQPELPPDPPDDTDTQETANTGTTGETGAPLPCPAPEVEPNDSVDEPTPLPMEKRGCGEISEPLDLDFWEFTLDDEGWIEIEVDAADGSIADMTLLVAPEGAGWAASRSDDPESLDASLKFRAPAGVYQLTASEQDFAGGDRYGYDVLVSEAKPPVEWTRDEVEPNDGQSTAEAWAEGDVIFGTMDGNGALPDFDWYAVTIPPGRHTLTVDVQAYDFGSSADLTVYLYDAALQKLPEGCKDPCGTAPGCIECAIEGGIAGVQLDPIGDYDSEGGEIVYVQVLEAGGREGPANWYTLTIGLEGT